MASIGNSDKPKPDTIGRQWVDQKIYQDAIERRKQGPQRAFDSLVTNPAMSWPAGGTIANGIAYLRRKERETEPGARSIPDIRSGLTISRPQTDLSAPSVSTSTPFSGGDTASYLPRVVSPDTPVWNASAARAAAEQTGRERNINADTWRSLMNRTLFRAVGPDSTSSYLSLRPPLDDLGQIISLRANVDQPTIVHEMAHSYDPNSPAFANAYKEGLQQMARDYNISPEVRTLAQGWLGQMTPDDWEEGRIGPPPPVPANHGPNVPTISGYWMKDRLPWQKPTFNYHEPYAEMAANLSERPDLIPEYMRLYYGDFLGNENWPGLSDVRPGQDIAAAARLSAWSSPYNANEFGTTTASDYYNALYGSPEEYTTPQRSLAPQRRFAPRQYYAGTSSAFQRR